MQAPTSPPLLFPLLELSGTPNFNGNNHDRPIEISDDGTDDAEDMRLRDLYIISIDPGKLHCAVVLYDAQRDVITKARLYNLLCTCPPQWRRKGQMEQSVDLSSPLHNRKSLRQKDIHVPSSHDFPAQLLVRMEDEGEAGPFGCAYLNTAEKALVAVERQNSLDSGNMVIEAALLSRFYGQVALKDPRQVKQFWNQAAASASLPVAFRMGSHSINKTDARRLGPRILSAGEQALLRREATMNGAHQNVCPSTLKHRKKGKKRKQQPAKEDDLIDAAAQAICVAQSYANIAADAPGGAAVRRLKQAQLRQQLDMESETLYRRHRKKRRRTKKKQTATKKKTRKM